MEQMLDVWQAATMVEEALNRLDHTCASTMTDTQLVDAMTRMRRLASRMEAEAAVWTSAAALPTQRATGTPLTDYLATTEARTTKEAQSVVHRAQRITSNPQVARAALAGQVPPDKAAAIGGVLRQLPAERMTRQQRDAAAAQLLAGAANSTTRQITGSGDRVLERVAPDLAPSKADRAALLERQRRRALTDRHLSFAPEQEGSVRFWGQLPTLEAAGLKVALQACVERGRRDESDQLKSLREQRRTGSLSDTAYLAARNELEGRQARSTGQRQADALTDMAQALAGLGQIPRTSGEPARLVITIDHQQLADMAQAAAATGIRPDGTHLDPDQLSRLRAGLADNAHRAGEAGHSSSATTSSDGADGQDGAPHGGWPGSITGTLETGEQIPGSALRLLCCAADLMPAVLGTDSQILDVGRTRRLVTPGIRQALRLRDQHCIFPGCTIPAAVCQAHHVIPWWAGGDTCVDNMVSLCAHHHGVVEPDRFNPAADQWTITFDREKMPHLIPPRRLARRLPTTSPVRGRSTPSDQECPPHREESGPDPEGPLRQAPRQEFADCPAGRSDQAHPYADRTDGRPTSSHRDHSAQPPGTQPAGADGAPIQEALVL